MTTQYAGHDLAMISKATDIQELWEPKYGDWYFANNDLWIMTGLMIKTYSLAKDRKNLTYLPTQRQLQEMLLDGSLLYKGDPLSHDIDSIMILLHLFTDHWDRTALISWPHIYPDGLSMEQLWLAFVMFKNFKKTWSGKEWEVLT